MRRRAGRAEYLTEFLSFKYIQYPVSCLADDDAGDDDEEAADGHEYWSDVDQVPQRIVVVRVQNGSIVGGRHPLLLLLFLPVRMSLSLAVSEVPVDAHCHSPHNQNGAAQCQGHCRPHEGHVEGELASLLPRTSAATAAAAEEKTGRQGIASALALEQSRRYARPREHRSPLRCPTRIGFVRLQLTDQQKRCLMIAVNEDNRLNTFSLYT